MVYDLTLRQQKVFLKIRGNKYGEGGSFFGMVANQALQYNKSFEEMLKFNLDIQADIDETYEELQKNKGTVSYTKE